MEDRTVSILNHKLIPGGWKVQKKNITQHLPDTVKHVIEEKEKIPGGWNSQMEANNIQYYCGRFEGTIKK